MQTLGRQESSGRTLILKSNSRGWPRRTVETELRSSEKKNKTKSTNENAGGALRHVHCNNAKVRTRAETKRNNSGRVEI